MADHGQIVSVTSEFAGDTLAAGASVGAETLTLEDVSPFDEEGGQAELDDGTTSAVVEYLTIDHELDTLTLTSPLAQAFGIETVVNVYPRSRVRIATVRLDDDDDAPIEARVTKALEPLLPQGIREGGGESVIVDVRRGEWVVVDVLGEEPDVVPGEGEPESGPPPEPLNVRPIHDVNGVICDWNDPLSESDADLIDAGIKGYQLEVVENGTPDFTLISETNGKRWLLRLASRGRFATTHYKRRYWFRVRTVGFNGLKSAWVVVGPVRPVETRFVRRKLGGTIQPSLIDLRTSNGLPLAGGGSDQAKMTSDTTRAVASLPGLSADGVATVTLTTGSTADRIYAGVAFRVVDADNYLYAAVVDRSGQNALVLGRCLAGTLSDLATDTSTTIATETTYEIEVALDGQDIDVLLDGSLEISTTSTSFLTAARYGLFCNASASLDNRESRFHEIIFTEAGVEDSIIDDDFDRVAAAVLGVAASGQTWAANRGTWEIEEVDVPFALYGAAMILPVFHMQSGTQASVQFPASGAALFGAGGEDTAPMTIIIDQPTRFVITASASVGNRSDANAYNARMFIVVEVDGTPFLGIPASQWLPVDGDPATMWRGMSTSREHFVDAAPDDPKTIELWWGFRASGGALRNASIREAKMVCWATYAPDYSEAFAAAQRIGWTRFGVTRRSYRSSEGDDPGE